MKKLLFLLIPLIAFSQSFLISEIPIPKTYIQNLDPYPCEERCLQEYIDNDMIFSFLANAKKKLPNKQQDEIRMMNISILNLDTNIISSDLKIAILLPYKKIGRYATTTTNSAFAYLITKNHNFELKSYKIENETKEDINKAIQQIKNDGFGYVVAPLTHDGATTLIDINPDVYVYIPTVNKRDINSSSEYIYYGGIDYKAQSDILLKEATSPLVIFHDRSKIGTNLSNYEKESFIKIQNDQNITQQNNKIVEFSIPRRITNLKRQLQDNENIVEGSFFLNTPIVKSGMIMSQITLYDLNATNILSTQINYDPLLLSMTQYNDRKDMIVANSITKQNNVLIESNSLLGNDIVYDWINYTTTIGVDYFFSMMTNQQRQYNIEIKDNQMQYDIELLRPSLSRFVKYVSLFKE